VARLLTSPAQSRLAASDALERAIELGRDVYASLSPEGQQALHLRGRKRQSLRKIARLRDIPNSTLSRSVAVYLLSLRHPEIREYSHVRLCHVAITLALEPEQRMVLLRRIEQGRWSRAQLQRAIKKSTPPRSASATEDIQRSTTQQENHQ
jgi:hypothetical protein